MTLPVIKAKTYALIRRGHEILLEPIVDANDKVKGYRPLGGGIEFRETAADGIKREMQEELGEDITVGALFCVTEDVFTDNGKSCHEIALIHTCDFINPDLYAMPEIKRIDRTHGITIQAQWLDPFHLPDNLPLWPEGFLAELKKAA